MKKKTGTRNKTIVALALQKKGDLGFSKVDRRSSVSDVIKSEDTANQVEIDNIWKF